MNIIVIIQRAEVKKMIALEHSEAIIKYIEKLPCPTEQKKEILAQIIRRK